jgi:hypothetical protein
MVRRGAVTPDTLVCEDGGHDWRLARKVPGLVPLKMLKAWQADVAAASKVEPPPPPAPVARKPTSAPEAPPAPAAPATPDAARPPSSVRRHAALALVIALAAAGGGIVGAVLVLRQLRHDAVPAPAPVTALPPERAATAPPRPDDARPLLARPEPPEELPPPVLALIAARMQPLESLRTAQREGADAFAAAGGLDASTVQTREALASRLAALDDVRERNEALRRALSAVPEQVRADVLKSSQPGDVAEAAARRARRELSAELKARDRDAEMHDVAAEVLGLLDDRFGTWTIDGHAIAFASGAGDAAQRYAELLDDAKGIAGR